MLTRTVVSMLVLLAFGNFASISVDAKELSSGAIKKLVKEYFDEDTKQPARKKIIESLGSISPGLLTKRVGKYLKSEEDRPKALLLATALKIPDLFKTLKKHYDSLDRSAIIDWCLITKDEDGLDFLLEKWDMLSTDSSEWKAVDGAFRKHRQASATLEHFRLKINDKARGPAALDILRWQMEKPELAKSDVTSKWKVLRAEYELMFKVFEPKNTDLLALEGWRGTGVTEVGTNIKVAKMGWWNLKDFPKKVGRAGVTLTLYVSHVDGDDGYVGLFQGASGFKVDFKPQGLSYCDPSGEIIEAVPYKSRKWQEIVWIIAPSKGGFNCTLKIDGRIVLSNGEYTAAPTNIGFFSKGVEFLAGGVDMKFSSK